MDSRTEAVMKYGWNNELLHETNLDLLRRRNRLNFRCGESDFAPFHRYASKIADWSIPETAMIKIPKRNLVHAIWVNTEDGLDQVVQDIRACHVVALSIHETHHHSFLGMTCALGISTSTM